MTVSSSVRRAGPFTTGSGPFAFSFKTFAKADLAVYRGDNATGNETLLVLDSDYTVSLNADQNASPGGSVTLSVALSSQTLVIVDVTAATQPADLITAGGWDPDTIEAVLDRAIMIAQRVSDRVSRTFLPRETEAAMAQIPKKLERASKLLGFDTNGDPVAVANTLSAAIVTAFGASLIDDADARNARRTLLWPASFVSLSAAPSALGASDDGKFYLCSGTFTVPFSAASSLGEAWHVTFKNNGTGVVTLDPSGAELIDNASTLLIYPGEQCDVFCTGFALFTMGLGRQYGESRVVGADCKNNPTTPDTQYDLDADWLRLVSPADNSAVTRKDPPVVTCNLSSAGPTANGRDQSGAFSAGSWIHLYWIWNGATLASIASTVAPPTGPTMPSGYTHWCYAGAVRWNASSQITRMRIKGSEVFYETGIAILTAGTATTETSIGISTTVPPNALKYTVTQDVSMTADGSGTVSGTSALRVLTGQTYYSYSLGGVGGIQASAGARIGPAPMLVLPHTTALFYINTNTVGTGCTTTVIIFSFQVPNGGE